MDFSELKITHPNLEDLKEMGQIAEEFFGTEEDDTQVEPSIENTLTSINIEKNNFICLKNKNGLVAWSGVLPTSKENMEKFLSQKINERELYEETFKQPSFETLYLTAVIVLPEYRKKGLGSYLLEHQIKYFQKEYAISDLYALILSPEGEKLINKVEEDLGIDIKYIKNLQL